MKRIYGGSGHGLDITLLPKEIKYLYFQNWVNASVKLQITGVKSKSPLRSTGLIEVEVTPYTNKNLPLTPGQLLDTKWVSNKIQSGGFSDSLTLGPSTPNFDFCVQCYFLIRL
jgi:hypothetical protein